jgi:SH3-like domain-containing protein
MTKIRSFGFAAMVPFVFAVSSPAQEPAPRKPGTVTGLPVPRYVSLKANEVNARVGPGRDYAIAWVFRRAGLPVEILNEFEDWRQIRDSSGSVGWVVASLVSGRRTAVVAPWSKPETLYRLASSRAQMEPGAIVNITSCDGEYCRVHAASREGYMGQRELWGVYPGERLP